MSRPPALRRPRLAAVTARPRTALAARAPWSTGSRGSLTAGALLVAAVLLVAGCATAPGPTPASSAAASSGLSSADPSPSAEPSPAAVASPWPDISSDPVEPSPSIPSFQPPAILTESPAATGMVLHVPVLMYHRIIPLSLAGNSLPGLVVDPSLFAAQMDALAAAGWHTITASQLASDLATGTRPPPRTFVITFDDGYDDGYTYALPVLQAHHFVATYYVIAERIGNPPGPLEALTPDHVRALAAAGMEIGNHTYNHVDLATASGTILHYQVVAASARIQDLVGTPPRTLAYPFGAWDAAAAATVKAAGMDLALTTVEGARETWATRFATPRVRVGPGTSPADLLALLRKFSAGP